MRSLPSAVNLPPYKVIEVTFSAQSGFHRNWSQVLEVAPFRHKFASLKVIEVTFSPFLAANNPEPVSRARAYSLTLALSPWQTEVEGIKVRREVVASIQPRHMMQQGFAPKRHATPGEADE